MLCKVLDLRTPCENSLIGSEKAQQERLRCVSCELEVFMKARRESVKPGRSVGESGLKERLSEWRGAVLCEREVRSLVSGWETLK